MATNAHIVDGYVPGTDPAMRARRAAAPTRTTTAVAGSAQADDAARAMPIATDLILVDLDPAACPDRAFAWPGIAAVEPGTGPATEPNTDARNPHDSER